MKAVKLSHYIKVGLFYTAFYVLFFSPVIFSDRIFPSDGLHAAFFSPFELWTNYVFAGYPAVAAIESQDLYPLTYIFSGLPGGFDFFILSVYVLSSFFVYGYIYTILGSTFAGLAGGLMFGLSGFMIAHLGHGSMIHAATWLPLLIWSLEKLRRDLSYLWITLAILAVTLSILAGHPQISVYSIMLSSVYVLALGRSATIGWRRYLITSSIVLIVGCLLAAVQIFPTLELMSQTSRSEMSFKEFVSYDLPTRQIVQLIFPYIFGHPFMLSPVSDLYAGPYFGAWNITELTGFVGISALFFAASGTSTSRQNPLAAFWMVIGIVTLLLAFGNETPLSRLMYHIPVVNKFRAPARYFLVMAFATSVLAAIGIHRLQTREPTKKLVFNMITAGSIVLAISLLIVMFNYGKLISVASNYGIEIPSFHTNFALIIPCLIFILSASVIVFWSKYPESYIRQGVLLAVIIIDLGSFSWFYEWRYAAPNATTLHQPQYAKRYEQILNSSHQRFLPLDSYLSPVLNPSLSRLFKVPSISGYGPFLLSRFGELTTVNQAGMANPLILASHDRVLDLLSVRFVSMLINRGTISEKGIVWSSEDLNIALGSGCDLNHPHEIRLALPRPVEATKLAVVSALGCSTLIQDEDEVIEIKLTDANQHIVSKTLRAGRDTSEWAFDCPDVRPQMQHARAQVFRTYDLPRIGESGGCQDQSYFTTIELDHSTEIKQIDLRYLGSSGSIRIDKISLVNDETQVSRPISVYDQVVGQGERWQPVETIYNSHVFENVRVLPRVWLVPEVFRAEPEAIFKAIRSSILPDGRPFEPSQTALVEEPLSFHLEQPDPAATATIMKLDSMRIEIRTDARSPAFLVLGDIYYPGWKATIDGVQTHLFRTNYILRGVLVPAGVHNVTFDYAPMSFYWGARISALTLLILVTSLIVVSFRARQKGKVVTSCGKFGERGVARPETLA